MGKELSRREKLERLNDLVIDTAIAQLEAEEVGIKDLGSIITLLKNNSVIDEQKQYSEAEFIDSLVVDKK